MQFLKSKISIFFIFIFIFTGICNVSKSATFSGDKLEKHILENIFVFTDNKGQILRLSFENNPKKYQAEVFKGLAKIGTVSNTWNLTLFKNSVELKNNDGTIDVLSFDEKSITDTKTGTITIYKTKNRDEFKYINKLKIY